MKLLSNIILNLLGKIDHDENYNEVYYEKHNDKRILDIFNKSMEFANRVLSQYKSNKEEYHLKDLQRHPLVDVINLLGKETQYKHISYTLLHYNELEQNDINADIVFFYSGETLTKDGLKMYDLIKRVEINKTINLSTDLIFPWPWNEERLANAIVKIGTGKMCGEFKQDFGNHNLMLWLPIGLTWVLGGNHSISSGILQGEGELIPRYVYDMSAIYDHVICDGLYYRRKHDHSIIGKVKMPQFAAIFEIGRIMKNENASF